MVSRSVYVIPEPLLCLDFHWIPNESHSHFNVQLLLREILPLNVET